VQLSTLNGYSGSAVWRDNARSVHVGNESANFKFAPVGRAKQVIDRVEPLSYMYDMLVVRLDPDLEQRLTFMAKRSGRTKSWLVRKAIEDSIEEMECIALLEEALRDPDAGRSVPLEQVMRERGLDY